MKMAADSRAACWVWWIKSFRYGGEFAARRSSSVVLPCRALRVRTIRWRGQRKQPSHESQYHGRLLIGAAYFESIDFPAFVAQFSAAVQWCVRPLERAVRLKFSILGRCHNCRLLSISRVDQEPLCVSRHVIVIATVLYNILDLFGIDGVDVFFIRRGTAACPCLQAASAA